MALKKFLFINSTEGFHEEQASTDELSLGKVTAVGVSGVAFDASNNKIVNVSTPTVGTDAANKQYVDDVASGITWKNSVRLATAANLPAFTAAGSGVGKTLTATANGALSVDGVLTVAGNRILKDLPLNNVDNGIYVVTQVGSAGTPYILTRATDFDGSPSTEVSAGDAVFVNEGTSNSDTGWVLITDDPIVVDTSTLNFTQFTGAASIIAGAGVSKAGNTLAVELDTSAGAQTAGTGGGSSGLEFDTSGDTGKIRVAVHATGGLDRSATGLEIRLDETPDTLDTGAAGLKVVGVPSLFKINGTAVGANVTATNVDTLVTGVNSSADALHRHDRLDRQFTAEETISVADPVFISVTTNDRVGKGVANVNAKANVIGVARTAAASSGSTFQVCEHGVLPGVLSGATVGTPYFLATSGGITTTAPGSGNRVMQVGYAMNATDLFVQVKDFGKKA